jgi:hypothetical protein
MAIPNCLNEEIPGASRAVAAAGVGTSGSASRSGVAAKAGYQGLPSRLLFPINLFRFQWYRRFFGNCLVPPESPVGTTTRPEMRVASTSPKNAN